MQAASVLLVGEQHPISGSEAQSLSDRVHAARGTRGEREFVEVTAEKTSRDASGVLDERLADATPVVRDWVRLECLPRTLCGLDRRAAARADRASVEVREPFAEKEVALRSRLRTNGLTARQQPRHDAARNGLQELSSIGR